MGSYSKLSMKNHTNATTGGQGQKSERGVQFPFQRGGQFFLSGGIIPPSTQKKFRLRHLLLFKVVKPPVINLRCGSYCLALYLQIIIRLKCFDPNNVVQSIKAVPFTGRVS